MAFEPEFIEKVREANNIVEIISEYTQLKGGGGRLMGLCPFPGHSEKTPSFSVSADKQVYHCFGCKKAGNVYTFVTEMKGLSFPEAVEYLATRASIAIPAQSRQGQGRLSSQRDRQRWMWKLNQFAAQYFSRQLQKAPREVLEYCERRGLNAELRERFHIGYAPQDWQGLTNELQKNRVPLDPAAKLGLVKARKSGHSYFDLFRHRLMFPILSLTGNFVGFGGRVLGEEQPKYLNSPDSDVFNKGRLFYGLHEAAKYIRSEDEAIIVEGYMDFLALYGAGYKNVVATLGTALTPYHAQLLKRFTKNVVVLFDSDSAGLSAARRSLPILLAQGLYPRHLALPGAKDPDQFINENSSDALKPLVQQAPELFMTVLRGLAENSGFGLADKVRVMDQIAGDLQATRDEKLRALYVDLVADRLQVERQWVLRAISEQARHELTVKAGSLHSAKPGTAATTPRSGSGVAPPVANPTAASATIRSEMKATGVLDNKIYVKQPPKAERFLLNIALTRKECLEAVLNSGVTEFFRDPGLKEIFVRLGQLYRQSPNQFDKLSASIATFVEPPSLVSEHLEDTWSQLGDEGAHKLLTDCSRKVKEAYLRAKAREKIADLRTHPTEALEQLEQIMNIQSNRNNLKNEKDLS